MDQRAFVERARQGDHDAFAELARRAVVRLDGAARLIVRDPELARDAVQDALIRAWRDLPGLRDPGRFDAWLHRLTVHTCLDLLRRQDTTDFVAGPDLPAQRIYVLTFTTDGVVTAHERFEYDPSTSDEGWALWSPDGSRFVLNAGARGATSWRVAVAKSDGTGGLTYTGRPTSTAQAMGHAWSPDGSIILAKYIEEQEAWLLDPDGGAGRQVPWWALTDDGPSWQRTAP